MIRRYEDSELRRKGFRIGVLHGKQLSADDDREYKIQREVYLVGNLSLHSSRGDLRNVRIIAYEVPLGSGSRSYSIDLIGYDQDFNIYLIEVKRKDNKETLEEDVVEQIDSYAEMFGRVIKDFEKEFYERFFYEGRFKKIKKLVLAPREYYQQKGGQNESFARKSTSDVLFGYFRNIQPGKETALVKASKMDVGVSFYRSGQRKD